MSIDELITAVVGLLGALIGLGGALAVSSRTARVAREQARYTRLHERRDEVLATLYSQLVQLHGEFMGVVHQNHDNPSNLQEKEKRTTRVRDALLKVDNYRSEHLLWLTYDITEVFQLAYNGYLERWNTLWVVIQERPLFSGTSVQTG